MTWCRSCCARRARARGSSTCRAIGGADFAIHESPEGTRYLVIHGDHFDLVVTQARWLALLGDKAYELAIIVNRVLNALRRRLGFGYWSLSKWAKLKVKNAVSYIGEFEKKLGPGAQA